MSKWTKEVPAEAGLHINFIDGGYYLYDFDKPPRINKGGLWITLDLPAPPIEFTDDDVAAALFAGPEAWLWVQGPHGSYGDVVWIKPDLSTQTLHGYHKRWVQLAKEALEKGWYKPRRLRGES